MPVEQGLPWHPVATGLAQKTSPDLLPCFSSSLRVVTLVNCSALQSNLAPHPTPHQHMDRVKIHV